MKIHNRAVRQLFATNDAVFDAAEIYDIGRQLENESS